MTRFCVMNGVRAAAGRSAGAAEATELPGAPHLDSEMWALERAHISEKAT